MLYWEENEKEKKADKLFSILFLANYWKIINVPCAFCQ